MKMQTAAGTLTTSYTRDATGTVTAVTQPDGSRLTLSYDAAHRLVGVTDRLGQKVGYTLDGLGDVTKATLAAAGGALAHIHTASYDQLGRLLQDIGGAGQATTYAYDGNGNRVSITDPLKRVTQQTFDALDRVTKIVNPEKGATTFVYDAQDRPVSVTDPNGNVTHYVYDGFGDVIETASPDTGATVFRYDAGGNMTQKTDAGGIVTLYGYDALGRLTAKSYPGSSAEDVTLGYDAAGGTFGVGHLTSVADASGTLQLVYDERGNVVRETRVASGTTLVTSYGYDAANRLASIAYPSGAQLAHARDAMGRITAASIKPSASASAMSVVSGVGYAPFGPVSALTYGNGIAESRGFDLDYRMTGIAAKGTAQVQKLGYSYNLDDDLVGIADGVTALDSQKLTYDALNRLVAATAGDFGTIGYGYDKVGNRLTETQNGTTASYAYSPHSNRLAAIRQGGATVRALGYAANGSVVTDARTSGTLALAYNHAARLATVSQSGATLAAYGYDGFGQRLSARVTQAGKTTNTLFQYDRAGHLIEEAQLPATAGGAIQRLDYVYLGDRPVARLNAGTGELDFLHDDDLGTPQLVTHAQQKTVWAASYQPFGAATTVGAFTQNLRFPGQYADAASGYSHNGFRDYDPTLGRYLQSDPIGLLGGLDTYAYVYDQPAMRTDRFGLQAAQACMKVFKYVGGKQADGLVQQALAADGVPNNPILLSGLSGAVLGGLEGGVTLTILGAPIGEGGGLAPLAGVIGGAGVGFTIGAFGAIPGVLWGLAFPPMPDKCICEQPAPPPKGQRQTGVPVQSVLNPGNGSTSYNGGTNGSEQNPNVPTQPARSNDGFGLF
jgi:RHS repeat-associated protein